MRYFHPALLALTAHAVAGQGTIEARADSITSNTTVELLLIEPFEPWPGFLNQSITGAYSSRRSLEERAELEKRKTVNKKGSVSAEACENIWPSPENKGWQFGGASCKRPNTLGNAYTHDCTAVADRFNRLSGLQKECPEGQACMEFHGQDALGEPAYEVTCVGTRMVREFTIEATLPERAEVCSAHYLNNVKNNNWVNMTLQANVLDSAKTNRIAPAHVYYKYVGTNKPVGAARTFDADVGSGVISVPHGESVQCCVQAKLGQALVVVLALTAYSMYVPEGKSG